jgi:hypothetical protein
VPVATAPNVAGCPTATVWFAGCVVIAGGAGSTVRVAGAVVVDPSAFDIVAV